jgi:antitoxin component of MazEF toxin-antitoxin module
LLRTDEMDYHVRPTDGKHAVVLPVGQEVEFKIKNDKMCLKSPDGDRKTRAYQVVAMEPANSDKDAAKRSD